MASSRISRVSAALHAVTTAVLILLPLLLAWALWTLGVTPEAFRIAFPDLPMADSIAWPLRYGALAVGLIPVAAALWTIWQMRALFGLYRRGETLTPNCAWRIRRIGLGMLALAGLGIVLRPMQVLLLTLSNPPGQRMVALDLGSGDVGFLLAGGMLLVIGWVMADAASMAEDNAGFV